MKFDSTQFIVTALIVGVGCLLFLYLLEYGIKKLKRRKGYEFKTLDVNRHKFNEIYQQEAQDGWELAGDVKVKKNTNQVVVPLKRIR